MQVPLSHALVASAQPSVALTQVRPSKEALTKPDGTPAVVGTELEAPAVVDGAVVDLVIGANSVVVV